MLELLEIKVYDNILLAWAVAVLILVGVLAVALIAKALLMSRLPEPKPSGELDWREVLRELVQRTSASFLVIAAIYAASSVLNLPRSVSSLILSTFVVALFIQLALWVDRLVSAVLAVPDQRKEALGAVYLALALIVTGGCSSEEL